MDTILSTVLFTDIVGSTDHQARLGDHDWKDVVEHHHAIVRESLGGWRGVENDTAGDGFYATFDGPARAIHCALEIRDRVHELGIEIRAGIHTGECELIDGKYAGIAVTTGARISALAEPSQVLCPRPSKTSSQAAASPSKRRANTSSKASPTSGDSIGQQARDGTGWASANIAVLRMRGSPEPPRTIKCRTLMSDFQARPRWTQKPEFGQLPRNRSGESEVR